MISSNDIRKILDDIEFYTKEIQNNYNDELFIVEFWTSEILHSIEKLKLIKKRGAIDYECNK